MDYIKQMNAFMDWTQYHDISDPEFRVYLAIFHCSNRLRWNGDIPNSSIEKFGDKDKQRLTRIRRRLVSLGLIEYKNGSKGKSGTYKLVPLYKADTKSDTNSKAYNDTYSDTDNDTDNDTNSDTIIKQKTIKQKTKNDNTPYSPPRGTDAEKPSSGKPLAGNRSSGKPSSGKPSAGKTDIAEQLDAIENTALREALGEFVNMRKQIKKPLTAHALELQVKKLYSMSTDTAELVKIVEQSVMNSWQGFYPLKDAGCYAGAGEFTSSTENVAEIEQAFIDAYSNPGTA